VIGRAVEEDVKGLLKQGYRIATGCIAFHRSHGSDLNLSRHPYREFEATNAHEQSPRFGSFSWFKLVRAVE